MLECEVCAAIGINAPAAGIWFVEGDSSLLRSNIQTLCIDHEEELEHFGDAYMLVNLTEGE